MIEITGQLLRDVRTDAGLGLRDVARHTEGGMRLTNSHLSRVECGTRGVSPAVIAAYERALGTRIAEYVTTRLSGGEGEVPDDRTFHATVAAVSVGGTSGEAVARLIAGNTLCLHPPSRLTTDDVAQVEDAARLVRDLDLRYGGEFATSIGRQLLRWATQLRNSSMTDTTRRHLRVALSSLAAWAAWAAVDAHQHSAARALFTLALEEAVSADEADLRAHILADIGAFLSQLGRQPDALHAVRLADGDERVGAAVRCILHGVRARVYASRGERQPCLKALGLAEEAAASAGAGPVPSWLGTWEPAHIQAVYGHARADLAAASAADKEMAEAHKMLTEAAVGLVASSRRRAAALCLTRLVRLHQQHGNTDVSVSLAAQAHKTGVGLRSVRLSRSLAALDAADLYARGPNDEEAPAMTPRSERDRAAIAPRDADGLAANQ